MSMGVARRSSSPAARPRRPLCAPGLTAAALLATALLPARAHAKREFPPDIGRHLSTVVDPACSVCHLDGKVAGVTVITPFALSLRAHGFNGQETTLNSALDAMQADGTDSDGDGVSDVDELRAGTDPNSPVPGATTADPTYGCAVAPLSLPSGWTAAALAAAVALCWTRRARRQRSRND